MEKKEIELAAAALGIKLRILDVKIPKDVEIAFQAAGKEKCDAVLFRMSGPLAAASAHRSQHSPSSTGCRRCMSQRNMWKPADL